MHYRRHHHREWWVELPLLAWRLVFVAVGLLVMLAVALWKAVRRLAVKVRASLAPRTP